MIVVGIIVVMLATAVMSVASGRGAVQVKEATRGVIQLSRYASALALLRQRPVVVTFFKNGRIEVRISGETSDSSEEGESSAGKGKPADPIYREVDGQETFAAAPDADDDDDDDDGDVGAEGSKDEEGKEKKSLFFTRQVLDPEALAKEDAEGKYEGVTFTVEVLGEDGSVLDHDRAMALSLPRPKRVTSDASLFMDGQEVDLDDEQSSRTSKRGKSNASLFFDGKEVDLGSMMSVTYETNGSVNPHRIIVRTDGETEADEGFAINISRSGKATVGDDIEEEERGRRTNGRRRRR